MASFEANVVVDAVGVVVADDDFQFRGCVWTVEVRLFGRSDFRSRKTSSANKSVDVDRDVEMRMRGRMMKARRVSKVVDCCVDVVVVDGDVVVVVVVEMR